MDVGGVSGVRSEVVVNLQQCYMPIVELETTIVRGVIHLKNTNSV